MVTTIVLGIQILVYIFPLLNACSWDPEQRGGSLLYAMFSSLPLDRRWRFRGDIITYTIDAFDLIDDTI